MAKKMLVAEGYKKIANYFFNLQLEEVLVNCLDSGRMISFFLIGLKSNWKPKKVSSQLGVNATRAVRLQIFHRKLCTHYCFHLEKNV